MLAKQRLYMKITTIVAAAIIGIFLAAQAVNAQATQPQTQNNAANSLQISPIRSDISADPGETKTVRVIVTNPTENEVAVRPVQNDFVARDEEGNPGHILEENEYAKNHSLKRFMQPLENFNLPGGKSEAVDVTITVPASAEPGGYFGAVRFMPASPDEGGQVNMSISTASIILLTVNGDAPEKLNLTDFVVRQNGRVGTFFTSSDKIDLMARFQNVGKVQVGPFGKISVTKGSEVIYEADFNSQNPKEVVLPDSARRWNIPTENISGFGKYTVHATFSHGGEAEQSFWVVPLPYIIGASVLILAIIGVVVGVILRSRIKKNSMTL